MCYVSHKCVHVYSKKWTDQRYQCHLCGRSYSRFWVLKRHLWEQHGFKHPEYAPGIARPRQPASSGFENFMPLILMMLHDRTQNKEPTAPANQSLTDLVGLSSKLIEPIASEFRRSLEKWNDYYPLPKDLISGFSCHECSICLTKQVIPIKDMGIDLICRSRHPCVVTEPSPLSSMPEDRLLKLTQLGRQMFQELSMCIDFWIPGKRLIVANKITLPDGNDKSTDRVYVQKQYGIDKKYHLEEVDFNRSPWLHTLFDNGKIEPTAEQLVDYCHGTYAILQSPDGNYYSAFLAPAKIIETDGPLEPSDFF
jgi:hypothetical protein